MANFLSNKQEHNTHDRFIVADDWSGNWQANVAIKITSILTWIIVVCGFSTSLIILNDIKEKQFQKIQQESDQKAYLILNFLHNKNDRVDSSNKIRALLFSNNFPYAELKIHNELIKFGQHEKKLECLLKPIILFKDSQAKNHLKLCHQPLKQIIREKQITTITIIGFITLIFAGINILIVSKIITSPFKALEKAIQFVKNGDLSTRMETKRHDEFGRVAQFFNDMLDGIQQDKDKIEESNRNLETIVDERTQELITTNKELRGTLDNLQQTQKQLVQSEKMAALGQLIAGITHEINTPLGVVQASIGNMSSSLENAIQTMPELLKYLEDEKLELFLNLIQMAQQQTQYLSTREERSYRRKISKILQQENFENADEIADTLVDMGIYDSYSSFFPLFRDAKNDLILQTSYNLATINKNSKNISIAIERATKVVFALKKFSHHDLSEKMYRSDINEDIETVLTLYQGNIKHGVDVTKNFEPLPAINCYHDELNQVWTNIIHNALQAMNHKGKLKIITKHRLGYIIVDIIDNGKGIPAEVLPNIFQAFFTTKKMGEGSGLGLDICQRIISRHKGRIKAYSKPNETIFRIILPINPIVEIS